MFGKKKENKPVKSQLESEHLSASFALKGDRTLNVTDTRLVSSHKGQIKDEVYVDHMGIPLENIQMVTPIKKNVIRVQFTMLYHKPETDIRLKHEYTLKDNDAESVCYQLTTILSKMFSYVPNDDGHLLLKEKPILTTPALSGKGDGTLYVTSTAIYFESPHEGLTFMMPLTMYKDCVIKKNMLVFKYEEIHTNGRLVIHEFKLRIKNINSVYNTVTKTYGKSDAQLNDRLKYLDKKFSGLPGKELKKILVEKRKDAPKIHLFDGHWERTQGQCNQNARELEEYAFMLAEKKFGKTRPVTEWCYCSIGFAKDSVWGVKGALSAFNAGGSKWCISNDDPDTVMTDPEKWYAEVGMFNADYHFIVMEARLILCALFADVPLEKLGDHTDSYLEMIKEFQKDFDAHRQAEMDYVEAYLKLKDIKGDTKDPTQFKRLLQNPDYAQYKEQYDKCKETRDKYYPLSHRKLPRVPCFTSKHSELQKKYNDVTFSFTEYHWQTTYAKRVEIEFLTLSRRIYDEWKKDIDLENFTDDSDYSWVDNIITNYPYPEKDAAVLPDLKTQISNEYGRSEGVRDALQTFHLEGIPKEDIINNDCWYDREREMWFSRCEKASLAASEAVMKPDQTRKECGYIAFGFPKEKVELIHGFPAIELPYDVFPVHDPNLKYRTPIKKRYVILTAVSSFTTLSKTSDDATTIPLPTAPSKTSDPALSVKSESDPHSPITPKYGLPFTSTPSVKSESDPHSPTIPSKSMGDTITDSKSIPFITESMIRDANSRVVFIENAPYTQTIKNYPEFDRDVIVRDCDHAKKTGRFIQNKVFPDSMYSAILEFETIDPEIGILNSGMMIEDTPSKFALFLVHPDGLIHDGMIRGTPASSGSPDSPLDIAVRMNAERLGNDYPAELLPLYERLRRHLFSVTTLCGVLTKPDDLANAVEEFNASL